MKKTPTMRQMNAVYKFVRFARQNGILDVLLRAVEREKEKVENNP